MFLEDESSVQCMQFRNYTVTQLSWFAVSSQWSHVTQMEITTPLAAQSTHPFVATQTRINAVLFRAFSINKSHIVSLTYETNALLLFFLRKWLFTKRNSDQTDIKNTEMINTYFLPHMTHRCDRHNTHHLPQELVYPYEQSSLQCQATVITVQATSIEMTHPLDNRDLTKRLKTPLHKRNCRLTNDEWAESAVVLK